MPVPPVTSRTIGLLLSGGLDSAILLGDLLRRGNRVQPFYIRGQLAWDGRELTAVRRYLKAMAGPSLQDLVILDMPLGDLYRGHWSVTGRSVPGAATADEAVYLPGRNALLIIKAAVWCQLHGIDRLALAVLASNPFADARPEFFAALQAALHTGGGTPLRILRPFARLSKRQVMRRGRGLPLELTFSCIAPAGPLHCGRCNKCAERQDAFRAAGMVDPTRYAAGIPSHNGARPGFKA